MKYIYNRVTNGVNKSPLVDHIYVKDVAAVSNISYELPPFGNYVLEVAKITFGTNNNANTKKPK